MRVTTGYKQSEQLQPCRSTVKRSWFNVHWKVNDLFADAVHYSNYKRIKKSGRYGNEHANKGSKMTKKALHMKDRTLSGIEPASVIAILRDLKAACDAYNIHGGVAMWLFEHCLSAPVEAVAKAWVALPTEVAKAKNGA